MKHLWPVAAASILCLLASSCAREPVFEGPYDVPPGFVVESLLPEDQAETLIQVTFDSLGRPVVSREQGPPTILFDNDGDGVYESEKAFSDRVEMDETHDKIKDQMKIPDININFLNNNKSSSGYLVKKD